MPSDCSIRTNGPGLPDIERSARALLGPAPPAGRDLLLAAVDVWPHKFGVSLLSAWKAAGEPLRPDGAARVAAARARAARYAEVTELVCAAVPGVWRMCGPATSRLYPAGMLRGERDVDLCAPGEPELWAAARVLADAGWRPESVRLRAGRDGAERAVSVVLERAAPPTGWAGDPDLAPVELHPRDVVELTTDPLEGDHWSRDSRPLRLAGTDSAVLGFVLLVEEGTGRPYGLRDVVDGALLLHALAALDRVPVAAELVGRAGLADEWHRLARGLDRGGLAPGLTRQVRPLARPDGTDRLATWRHPLRRTALRAGHAVRAGGRSGERASALLTGMQERVGLERHWAARVALFGIPVTPPPPGPAPAPAAPAASALGPAAAPAAAASAPAPAAQLTLAGPRGLLRTPVGDFALSNGGDLRADWLP